jgi:hypothetical protein
MTLDSAPVTRHGALGISSFIVALLMATVFFLDMAFAGYAHASGTSTPGANAVIGLVMFFSWFLGLIAIGLGIAGYRDKTAKRGFSVAGMGISGAAIAVSVGLMVMGLSQKA